MSDIQTQITDWLNEFGGEGPETILSYFFEKYGDRAALATGLGAEGQVLTDMAARLNMPFRIFTIDTGRLYPETYKLMDRTNRRYNICIEVYFPNHLAVENYVKNNGINGFYNSVEQRKACCKARKTESLQRILSTLDVWICGLRSEQSMTRSDMKLIEWDAAHGLIKINPLIHWTEKQVWEYIRVNSVPYNPLHDKGFPSIGCQPCTRAIKEGDDIRSGRWWWESPEHKECGLHRK